MEKSEILKLLKEWARRVNETDSVYATLNELLGVQPESALGDALYKALSSYTEYLEKYITGSTTSDWLSWYHYENDMGTKKFEANPGTWEDAKPIASLSDLADLLIASREQEKDPHILVAHVRGGILHNIYCSLPEENMAVTVVDFDSTTPEQTKEGEYIIKEAQRTLNNIW